MCHPFKGAGFDFGTWSWGFIPGCAGMKSLLDKPMSGRQFQSDNRMATNPTIPRPSLGCWAASRIMRIRTKAPLLAAGAFFAAGFIVWPGCGSIPLRASRTPVSTLTRTNFSFVRGAHPTRSDIGCTPQAASREYVTLQAGLGRASPRWFVMIHPKLDKQQSFVV